MSIVLSVHYHIASFLSRCFYAFIYFMCFWQNNTQAAASSVTLQPRVVLHRVLQKWDEQLVCGKRLLMQTNFCQLCRHGGHVSVWGREDFAEWNATESTERDVIPFSSVLFCLPSVFLCSQQSVRSHFVFSNKRLRKKKKKKKKSVSLAFISAECVLWLVSSSWTHSGSLWSHGADQ